MSGPLALALIGVGVALLFTAGVIWFVTRGLRHVKRHDGWPDGS